MPDRSGKRKTREQFSKRRIPELGYYFIVTDTKETEQNYMLGLRDSIPKDLQGKIVIKVCEAKQLNLLAKPSIWLRCNRNMANLGLFLIVIK